MSFCAGLENHNNLPEVKRPLAEYYANKGRRKLKEELIGWEPVIQKEVRKRQPNIVYYCIYVESRKMGQPSWSTEESEMQYLEAISKTPE